MKFCLINLDSPFLIDPKVFPPLGVLYLSAMLKAAGHEVEVIDLAGGGLLPLVETDIYGITATTPQFPLAVDILHELKKRRTAIWVLIGGPHATVDPVSCLEAGFDQVVIGEGEQAILKVAAGCRDKVIEEPFIDDLGTIPFPDRGAIAIGNYYYYLGGMRTANIMTSRGCPYHCSFCVKNWGRRVRYRSPGNVLAETQAIKQYGYGAVMLYDDEFFLNKPRDKEIVLGLKEQVLPWRCFSRADLLDEETVALASECGCQEILIGVESGSDRILNNINKGTTREINKRAIALLKRYKIRVKAAFIIGLPGENQQSIKETDTFIEETQPDDVDFTVLTVYPGSDIYNNPNKYELSFTYSCYPYKGKPGEYKASVATPEMTCEEVIKVREYLEAKFKSWQG